MSDKNNQGRHQGVTGEADATASEITTPAESSDLSDSQFNYEMQNNWSMIFTDDNDSADHDLRSNYSSSVDDNGMDVELVSESGIISETDSEYPTYRNLFARRLTETSNSTLKPVKEQGIESLENSHSTLKNSAADLLEGSYHFPDPLSDSQQNLQEVDSKRAIPPVEKTRITPSAKTVSGVSRFGQLKSYAVYIVLGLLLLDRSIQLFDIALPSSKMLFGSSPIPVVVQPSTIEGPDDEFDAVTIIRYATKTETYFIPDPTTTVETVYETVDPTYLPSWLLAKQLYNNFVDDAKVAGENLWEKATAVTDNAVRTAKTTLDELKDSDVPEKLVSRFQNFYASAQEGRVGIEKSGADVIHKVADKGKDWYKTLRLYTTPILQATQGQILSMTKAAALSAWSIQYSASLIDLNDAFKSVRSHMGDLFHDATEGSGALIVKATQGTSTSIESLKSSSFIFWNYTLTHWKDSVRGVDQLCRDHAVLEHLETAQSGILRALHSSTDRLKMVGKNAGRASQSVYQQSKAWMTSDETADVVKNMKFRAFQTTSKTVQGALETLEKARERLSIQVQEFPQKEYQSQGAVVFSWLRSTAHTAEESTSRMSDTIRSWF